MISNATPPRAKRIPTRLDTYYAYGRVEGAGVLANISYSGALIEGTHMQPDVGTPVVLLVCLYPPGAFQATSPFELVGRVARHSPSGFAVQYPEDGDPRLRRLVDDAAVIAARRN